MAGGKMRVLSLSVCLCLTGLTGAFACDVGEVELFSCPTKAAPQGIALCGQVGEGDKTWRGIRYIQALYKNKFFEYPQSGEMQLEPILFSHRSMQQRYEMNERFSIGKDYYTLYYRDALRDEHGMTKDQPEARVEIRNIKGGMLKTIQCTAKPVAYFREMREASTCDETPTMIGANCYGKAPDVYLGLDPKKQKSQVKQVVEIQKVIEVQTELQGKQATRSKHRRRHQRRG